LHHEPNDKTPLPLLSVQVVPGRQVSRWRGRCKTVQDLVRGSVHQKHRGRRHGGISLNNPFPILECTLKNGTVKLRDKVKDGKTCIHAACRKYRSESSLASGCWGNLFIIDCRTSSRVLLIGGENGKA